MPDPKYYDPVKAHEYYMRTRELKGREPAKLKTDAKKDAFNYSKTQIDKAKKKRLEGLSEDRKKDVERLRNIAEMKRAAIRKQVEDLMNKLSAASDKRRQELSAERTKAMEQIVKRAQSRIDALPKAPKGLSKEAARKFAEDRAKKVAQIKGEATTARQKVAESNRAKRLDYSKGVATIKGAVRERGRNQNAMVSAELKQGIEKARNLYSKLKEEAIQKYKDELDQERTAISKSRNI